MVGSDYARGWDDCLNIIISIIDKGKSLDDIKEKIEYIHVLVKEKRFEKIKEELGILRSLF